MLDAIGEAWRDRRDEVLDQRRQHRRAQLADRQVASGAGRARREADCDAAVDRLQARVRPGAAAASARAPKFPPSMVLEALLRDGGEAAMTMVERTCEAMARGGIYDQLGGGFARYSVDAGWVVPHFEKMLYDNALLLGVYTHWWRRTGDPLAERVVAETVDWLLRGDADRRGRVRRQPGRRLRSTTHGHLHEGAFYAWTPRPAAGRARARTTDAGRRRCSR